MDKLLDIYKDKCPFKCPDKRAINRTRTKSEIAKRINKSEKTVQRVIASLIDKKLITRVGSNKDGY